MIVNKDIENYIDQHSTIEDPVLSELNRETHLKVINPRMLSGHPQGKILELISKMIRPETILEIGTFTGYSAICLARGLKPGGKLHTIERNDELVSLQDKYFNKAGLSDSIVRHVGNALDIIPNLNNSYDLVFIDADKKNYTEYLNLVIDKVNSGGIILADNVLWDGKVVEKPNTDDIDTISIQTFNKTVANDPRMETTILPVRDGISIIRKF